MSRRKRIDINQQAVFEADLRTYIQLRLDFDYCLLSLYEAQCNEDNDARLTILDELYDLQVDIQILEKKHPRFKHLNISI